MAEGSGLVMRPSLRGSSLREPKTVLAQATCRNENCPSQVPEKQPLPVFEEQGLAFSFTGAAATRRASVKSTRPGAIGRTKEMASTLEALVRSSLTLLLEFVMSLEASAFERLSGMSRPVSWAKVLR
jgi:hypothetical protein